MWWRDRARRGDRSHEHPDLIVTGQREVGGRPKGRPPTRKVRMLATTEKYRVGGVYVIPKAIADSWVAYGVAEDVSGDAKLRETKAG